MTSPSTTSCMPLSALSSLKKYRSYLESYGCYTLGDAFKFRDRFKNRELHGILEKLSEAPKPWELRLSIQSMPKLRLLRTYNEAMDRSLGGGFPLGSIIEVFGYAGVGKSQLALHLACTAQAPRSMGGLGGSVLYLHTESAFYTNRLQEIASATSAIWSRKMNQGDTSFSLLDRVYVFRIDSPEELLGKLRDWETSKFDGLLENVRLLILDSIAYPFRFQEESREEPSLESTSKLFQVFNLLNRFALKRNSVVLITNQMRTQIRSEDKDEGFDAPALGLNWSSSGSTKVHLDFHPLGRSIRSIQMIKCTYNNEAREKSYYCVTGEGIRDASEAMIQKAFGPSSKEKYSFS